MTTLFYRLAFKQEMISTPLNEWEKAVNGHPSDLSIAHFNVKITMREWFQFMIWIYGMIMRLFTW